MYVNDLDLPNTSIECDLLGAEMKVLYSLKYASDYGGEYAYL